MLFRSVLCIGTHCDRLEKTLPDRHLTARPITCRTEGCQSGRMGRSRTPLRSYGSPWVRIPLLPPGGFFSCRPMGWPSTVPGAPFARTRLPSQSSPAPLYPLIRVSNDEGEWFIGLARESLNHALPTAATEMAVSSRSAVRREARKPSRQRARNPVPRQPTSPCLRHRLHPHVGHSWRAAPP